MCGVFYVCAHVCVCLGEGGGGWGCGLSPFVIIDLSSGLFYTGIMDSGETA